MEKFSYKIINLQDLLTQVKELREKKYRLVSISCTQVEEKFELLYTFDLNLSLKHLKIIVAKDTPIPSLTCIYEGAFLLENEIQYQFGLSFAKLNIDYKGQLFYPEKNPLFLKNNK